MVHLETSITERENANNISKNSSKSDHSVKYDGSTDPKISSSDFLQNETNLRHNLASDANGMKKPIAALDKSKRTLSDKNLFKSLANGVIRDESNLGTETKHGEQVPVTKNLQRLSSVEMFLKNVDPQLDYAGDTSAEIPPDKENRGNMSRQDLNENVKTNGNSKIPKEDIVDTTITPSRDSTEFSENGSGPTNSVNKLNGNNNVNQSVDNIVKKPKDKVEENGKILENLKTNRKSVKFAENIRNESPENAESVLNDAIDRLDNNSCQSGTKEIDKKIDKTAELCEDNSRSDVKKRATGDKKEELSNKEEENVDVTDFKPRMRWPDTIAQLFIHIGCLYGFFLLLTQAKFNTVLWAAGTVILSGFGITAGAHRLWSHRSYKATWPLRAILIFLFTISGQRDAYTWALDHRVHHKYSETDSDPHNARRGFFFAHVGWLVVTPHPEVEMRRKQVDMKDLEADPIVMWQRRYYIPLFALLAIGLPVLTPCYLWQESLWTSFWVNFNWRFCVTLNIAFFVNSVAHMWGQKPYDKNISPVENIGVAIAALGEGWHNYHHVFPYDYKTGELGGYTFNPTTGFIDFFARLGWAYDRKSVSQRMIARRAMRCGDGSYLLDPHNEDKQVWGYGDADIDPQDLSDLIISQPKSE